MPTNPSENPLLSDTSQSRLEVLEGYMRDIHLALQTDDLVTAQAICRQWERVPLEPSSPPAQAPGQTEAAAELTHGRNCSARFRLDGECSCGLEWRKQIETERSMHKAWRKRAEEAEAELERLRAPAPQLRQDETSRCYPEYTYAIGEAGDQYIRSVAFQGQHHLPALFRWSDLWDALNRATNSLEHVRQSPQGSVPAIGAPTAPAAPGSSEEPSGDDGQRLVECPACEGVGSGVTKDGIALDCSRCDGGGGILVTAEKAPAPQPTDKCEHGGAMEPTR